MPRHVQDVAEALGGDHPHVCPVTFNDDVGGDRGAVKQRDNLAGLDASDGAQLYHSLHYANRLVLWRAGHFVHKDLLAAIRPHRLQHEVGEGAAHVNAYPDHPCIPCR